MAAALGRSEEPKPIGGADNNGRPGEPLSGREIYEHEDHEPAGLDIQWPMRCICNLCDCGGHRCSSFGLIPAAGQLPAADNGAQPRPAEDRSRPGRNQVGRNSDSHERPNYDQPDDAGPGRRRHHCNYAASLAGERYLARESAPGAESAPSLGAPGRNRSSPASSPTAQARDTVDRSAGADSMGPGSRSEAAHESAEAEPDARLVHLLVTRPQKASKPRDNILFEGDMDLRTTFETSYEALARMRLDHWRRQQAAEPSAGHQVSVAPGPPSSGAPGARHRRQAPAHSPGPRSAADSNHKSAPDKRRLISGAEPPTRPDDSQQPANEPLPGAPIRGSAAKPAHDQVQARDAAGVGRHRAPQQRSQSTYIDPDLSPIIVYDANMNRLERVGLRKRSKYRPSTSLRSGARGLFGDQQHPEPPVTSADNKQPTGGPQQAAAGLPLRGAGMRNDDQPSETCDLKSARLHLQSPSGRGGPVAANLDQNFPFNSKRKLFDNINMTDNIREQNIVESATPTPTPHSSRSRRHLASPLEQELGDDELGRGTDQQAPDGQPGPPVEPSAELQRLTEAEELAAVEEIQRCTADNNDDGSKLVVEPSKGSPSEWRAGPKQQQTQQQQQQQQIPVGILSRSSNEGTRSSASNYSMNDRRTKLERTCQNQSFYLFENEYPEPSSRASFMHHLGTLSPNEANQLVASKQLMDRKNLFRESPDFMLTTGRYAQQQQQQQQGKSKTCQFSDKQSTSEHRDLDEQKRGQQHSNELGALRHHQMANPVGRQHDDGSSGRLVDDNRSISHLVSRRTTPEQCKVLCLDTEFKFVGSRSGHKYFVEKQVEVEY